MKTKIVKGWKVFNENLSCKGFKYEVGKTYEYDGNVVLCQSGFHFHENIKDLWNYYSFNKKNKVCEIEAKNVITGDDKSVCKDITIIRLMTWEEVLKIGNSGDYNIGWNNTGDRNTGYRNTGDRNTGDRNTGDRNTGYSNIGDSNTGDRNTGNRNTGDRNTGDRNTGDRNTGDRNTGDRNTGYSNTGDRNTGDSNTGDSNTGYRNTGDRNTGDFNSCNYSSGMFNSIEQKVSLFNGAAYVLMSEFKNTKNYYALFSSNFNITKWIDESDMTDKEKKEHKYYYVQGGYLKVTKYKDACSKWWNNMTPNNKELVLEIPGFDKKIFFEITGIKI